MDRNNPVWREYLKAVIRIQIDAGVDGIQLDEAELPLGALQYGACFCRDCMEGFRAHLHGAADTIGRAELLGVDLDTFHYGDWLLAQGYDFRDRQAASPLFGALLRLPVPAPSPPTSPSWPTTRGTTRAAGAGRCWSRATSSISTRTTCRWPTRST